MFTIHFVRRFLETIFLNKYVNKETPGGTRLSDIELIYYFTWGVLNGCSGSQMQMHSFGAVPMPVLCLGIAVWVIGSLLQPSKSQVAIEISNLTNHPYCDTQTKHRHGNSAK
jgi:hypothetical protein